MKIAYITQHYRPETGAAAVRAGDMARLLSEKGHHVSVLTSFPHGRKARFFKKENEDGVEVRRGWQFPDTKKSSRHRLANYISFVISAVVNGLFVRKPDVVVATYPHLFGALAGYVLSRLKGVPFVFEVRDMWVDFARILGQIKSEKAYRKAKKLENFLARKADLVVTVTEGYKKILMENGIPEEKITVVTNGVSIAALEETAPETQLPDRKDAELTIVYAGNIGLAQRLETFIEAAESLRGRSGLSFVIVGEGARRKAIEQLAAEKKLDNVTILPPVSRGEMARIYREADLAFVPLLNHELFSVTIPSKIFDSMAGGLPVLIGVDGEAREIVESLEGGAFYEPENARSLTEVIAELHDNPDQIARMKSGLRDRVIARYSRRKLAGTLETALGSLIRKGGDRK
ncbi:hypothetical protein CR205_15940 [Alteribacter lacisalsi]|uniref:Glycosyltransferase WbuB n=1 Tax=Alteribacter lacisalsi TaxID=2045244 RepID=A0A2W0HG67_9BACI|nr:glycosyltransferase family 4 protein [Alteribacter lacisalsi]PYZ95872.1 hypothetical protein CR205_15940 [Alteribacter lacisalsi]